MGARHRPAAALWEQQGGVRRCGATTATETPRWPLVRAAKTLVPTRVYEGPKGRDTGRRQHESRVSTCRTLSASLHPPSSLQHYTHTYRQQLFFFSR